MTGFGLGWLRQRLEQPGERVSLDPWLCLAAASLLAWGLVMVASASVAQAEKMTGDPFHYFWRQLVFVGLGTGLGFLVFRTPMRLWERHGLALALAALGLLLIVLVPFIGVEVKSARRWLDLGLFRLQASEPARLMLILYLAGYIVRRQARLQTRWSGLLLPFLPLLIAAGLLILEPDFGATAILLAVAMIMLFLGGARLLHLILLGVVALAGLALVAVAEAYRVRRLIHFSDPFKDIENGGWQLAQSLIAVGRGEVTGVGLGNSIQKLLYLPEMHTDFIFAILAEEFGLIGVAVLIGLFALLVARAFAIGARAEVAGRRFPAYLVYGIASWLGLQTLINLAVNMGALPTKGLTLPLMSYGGSSLITVMVMLALVLRVDWENRQAGEGRADPARAPRAEPAAEGLRFPPLAARSPLESGS
ncbi:MAG TPA: putative lipid II flippase FtsW [Nevskiaceae bacterium]|nr:putative lipid II flippase FtsW [Nevskiaceae bacterium]